MDLSRGMGDEVEVPLCPADQDAPTSGLSLLVEGEGKGMAYDKARTRVDQARIPGWSAYMTNLRSAVDFSAGPPGGAVACRPVWISPS